MKQIVDISKLTFYEVTQMLQEAVKRLEVGDGVDEKNVVEDALAELGALVVGSSPLKVWGSFINIGTQPMWNYRRHVWGGVKENGFVVSSVRQDVETCQRMELVMATIRAEEMVRELEEISLKLDILATEQRALMSEADTLAKEMETIKEQLGRMEVKDESA